MKTKWIGAAILAIGISVHSIAQDRSANTSAQSGTTSATPAGKEGSAAGTKDASAPHAHHGGKMKAGAAKNTAAGGGYQQGSVKQGSSTESRYGNNSAASQNTKGEAMRDRRPGSGGDADPKKMNERPRSSGAKSGNN